MIFTYPRLGDDDRQVLDMIRGLRIELRFATNSDFIRWKGFLRRTTFAKALQGSNSIEGINANMEEAVAIIDDERPDTLEDETFRALQGYRTAMTYILSLQDDPHLEINAQLIRSLHFMMLNYDMTKMPGQWRNSVVHVVREEDNETVYEGPHAGLVPDLMGELAAQANSSNDVESSTVLAAMVHLNLAMIHPFKDGNGRMARALQTLVLARQGVVSPIFSSIEEWLGRNTNAYYRVLADVGQGKWNPQNDALPWVRFCLKAHFQQAERVKKRNELMGRVWAEIEKLLKRHRLNERMQIALMDAAYGYRVRNQRYRTENDISEVVASRDFKILTDLNMLVPIGEKRGRHYVAGPEIAGIRNRLSQRTPILDPYEVVAEKAKSSQLAMFKD